MGPQGPAPGRGYAQNVRGCAQIIEQIRPPCEKIRPLSKISFSVVFPLFLQQKGGSGRILSSLGVSSRAWAYPLRAWAYPLRAWAHPLGSPCWREWPEHRLWTPRGAQECNSGAPPQLKRPRQTRSRSEKTSSGFTFSSIFLLRMTFCLFSDRFLQRFDRKNR